MVLVVVVDTAADDAVAVGIICTIQSPGCRMASVGSSIRRQPLAVSIGIPVLLPFGGCVRVRGGCCNK